MSADIARYLRTHLFPADSASGTRQFGGRKQPLGRASDPSHTLFGPRTTMQHPILTALDGGAKQVPGEVVLDGIGEILSRLLPDVPQDDPYRPALVALACAAGCQRTEPRARLTAL